MRHLFRVVRISVLRYPITLFCAMICSLLVGALWGANIGVLYPFVKIVFSGQSMQESLQQQIDEHQAQTDELNKRIGLLNKQIENAPPGEKHELKLELESLSQQLHAENKGIETANKYLPLAQKYLPQDPFLTLVIIIGGVVFATFLKSMFLVGNDVLVSRVTQDTMTQLQHEFYAKVMKSDLNVFGEDRASQMISVFTQRIWGLTNALQMLFGQAVREPLKMFACLFGAAIISWQLLVISLIVAPIGMLLLHLLTRAIRRGSRKDLDLTSALYQRLSESFHGVYTIKSFNAEVYEGERYVDVTTRLANRRKRNVFFLSLIKPVSEVMGIAIVAIAILASSYLVLNRETHLFGIKISTQPLNPAALLIFYGFLAGVADPARKLTSIYGAIIFGGTAAEQIFTMMDRKSRITDPENPMPVPQSHRELCFEEVDFAYQKDTPIIENLSLKLAHGERVAIVGPNGCGKSTLAKLIQRFYDPRSGRITVDGIDVRNFQVKEWRQKIGIVSQQTWLFDETVMNNIRYGKPDATDEEVIEAAKHAQAHDFIVNRLSHGYETVVGERGESLSGGQRQRIALARILLRDPDILILDEATSEIDPESEKVMHQVLDEFLQGRTTIMITHRVSSLGLANRIIVMDHGSIQDFGTHQELMDRCEAYQRLWSPPELRAA
jgi:ATP-binding cassette subfamily B protein/subfamily B ATP-binding cassette protein MsbA